MDCSLPGSSVHRDSLGKNTGVGCCALLQGNLPHPGIEPRSPALQVDSLLFEPPACLWIGYSSLTIALGMLTLLDWWISPDLKFKRAIEAEWCHGKNTSCHLLFLPWKAGAQGLVREPSSLHMVKWLARGLSHVESSANLTPNSPEIGDTEVPTGPQASASPSHHAHSGARKLPAHSLLMPPPDREQGWYWELHSVEKTAKIFQIQGIPTSFAYLKHNCRYSVWNISVQ